jgi:hypothetical protein
MNRHDTLLLDAAWGIIMCVLAGAILFLLCLANRTFHNLDNLEKRMAQVESSVQSLKQAGQSTADSQGGK